MVSVNHSSSFEVNNLEILAEAVFWHTLCYLKRQSFQRNKKERDMPGRGGRFTEKEDRQAEHIKDSEKKEGRSEKDAERIAYATVNKQKSEKKKNK
jgi:hypothetical protein